MFDEKKLRDLWYNTRLTCDQIAKELGYSTTYTLNRIYKIFTIEEIQERKRLNYSISKKGDKNPMKGKFREQHPTYKEHVSDGRGYWMVLKPDWYTGRKGCNHIYEHHEVMCRHLGLTEVPAGYVIHHIDGNKLNNDINNLALMTNAAHSKLHNSLKVQRLSREGVGEESSKCVPSVDVTIADDDIVQKERS